MAKFRIKLGARAEDSEVIVNGRRMQNIIGLSVKQVGLSRPAVMITIPAEEVELEGEGDVEIRNALGYVVSKGPEELEKS